MTKMFSLQLSQYQKDPQCIVFHAVNDQFICRFFKKFSIFEIGKFQLTYDWKDIIDGGGGGEVGTGSK